MTHSLIPTHQLPLYGKRILITAPRTYAARLASEVLNRGGIPLLMPTIETCQLADYEALNHIIKNLTQFDWIAFTSRNGIEAFIQQFTQLKIPLTRLNQCQLIAIGKDADKLTDYGLTTALIPQEPSPQGIVTRLAQLAQIDQQSILTPIPQVMGISEPDIIPNFITGLQQLGMKVTPVYTYQTRCLEKFLYRVEIELLKQRKIDVIAFSSTGEIDAFLQLINHTQDYQDSLIACFGPYTAANAKKLGLTVDIVAENYDSFSGFVQAIANYFTLSNSTAISAE